MTTALPAQATTPSGSPLPDLRRLRIVADHAQGGDEGHGAAPLVGYLVLVPEGTDPTELFAKDVTRPEIRPVAYTDSPPVRQTRGDAVRIDTARHAAEADGRELDLTYLEFALLAHLVSHPHHVHTREQLMVRIWGYDHIGDGRTVDVHIARLRRKLGAAHRYRIVTVRRMGYKYVPDQQQSPDSTSCH
ncbi:DNA-binding winged helix-turn-helix (wHTH) protein [Streptomyces griseochromogenes]|uniref:DNA-binding winged helix-turn-helix (WHTH) protein n=1 Tax=Streptomyces griseochromogenes TaxID=68214 RepID=A0A1B1AWH0_9ACTN|nr:winged helix-turn-helix domain-containing protein [Streptomyces griseochromogenes]ANP50903.1 transcriptional regulator [Streptomyces griseochromogenes]MBP2052190.1 DNA-binding winged helix-turn-helix (wHTH) protein [Streptomyces griseochromogenes]